MGQNSIISGGMPDEARTWMRTIADCGLRVLSDESSHASICFCGEFLAKTQRNKARASNLVSMRMLVTGKNTWASKKLNRKAQE